MAEGGVSETPLDMLEEDPKKINKCSICLSGFKDPRQLNCSHNFCLKCLQELKQARGEYGENIACPLCREETLLPERGVDGLLCSQKVVTTTETQDEDQSFNQKIICQACDEENEAISRCMDCEHYLCQECEKAHNRLASLQNHKVATLAELGPDGKLEDRVPKCKEHPDHELCLFCKSCDVLICNKCTDSNHRPSTHFHSSIDEAYYKCKRAVHDAIGQTEESLKKFIDENPLSTSHSRARLATRLRSTKIQISLKAESEITKIRKKEQQTRQKVQDTFYERDKHFAYPITAEQVVSRVRRVMETASCYEALDSQMELLQDLREQINLQKTAGIKHAKSLIGFKESEVVGELGTLLLEDKWERIKITMNKKYQCFKALSGNEVVFGGCRQLISDRSSSSFSAKRKLPQAQNPTVIASYTGGFYSNDLSILDSPAVKIVENNDSCSEFMPGEEADISSKPTCLAAGELIAVGYKDSHKISLHYVSGFLIRTIHAPNIGQHMTMHNKQLIYTYPDSSNDELRVRCLDFNGKEMFTFPVPCKGTLPGLVCCDAPGNIYVAIPPMILKFNKGGTAHLDSMSCECLKNPRDMGFSPDGKLLVLDDTGLWEYKTMM